MSTLDGKIILVTGAARGLGRAMTLALAEAGARVGALDLAASAEATGELLTLARGRGIEERILPVAVDITKAAEVEAALAQVTARFGALHGLVNNAGRGMQDIGPVQVGPRKPFYEVAVEAWQGTIDTNLNGAFIMARAVAPRLIAGGGGRIVNVVTSFRTMQAQGFSPYGPSKAALEAATVIWAKDLAGTGVTVNALLPGGAANTRMIPQHEIPDRSILVQPEAMQAPIVWLMSAAAGSFTGRRFVAKDWDPALASEKAAEIASAAAGFPD